RRDFMRHGCPFPQRGPPRSFFGRPAASSYVLGGMGCCHCNGGRDEIGAIHPERCGSARRTAMNVDVSLFKEIRDRLAAVESALQLLVSQRTVKDWYSTAEVAELLCK